MSLLDELFGSSSPSSPAAGATPDAPNPLMAFLRPADGSFGGADALQAIGAGLMTGDRFHTFGPGFQTALAQASRNVDARQSRAALAAVLKNFGFSDEDAYKYSASKEAAELAVSQRMQATNTAMTQRAIAGAPGLDGLFGGGGGAAPGAAATPPAPGGPAAGVSLNAPSGTGAQIQSQFVDNLKAGGLTNPYGLAAVAAYAQHESKYDPKNINGTWSDPSESGQAGTSGGILSWRGDRLNNMQAATRGAQDPVAAQAQFTLSENPQLTAALQNARSPEEANALMADAWKFAGYNQPDGGEYAARLATTRSYAGRFTGADGQRPTRVADASGAVPAGADPLAGFVPTPGGGADNPDPGAPQPPFGIPASRTPVPGSPQAQRAAGASPATSTPGIPPFGSTSSSPPPPTRPLRPGAVRPEVAENEEDTQRLEQQMGMVPTQAPTNPPTPARPSQVAQADMPAEGAQDAGFYVPGANGAPGRTFTGRTAEALRARAGADPTASLGAAPASPEDVQGATTQRAQAARHYGYWSKFLAAAGANKGLAEYAKSQMEISKEFLKPDQIENKLDAAGITGAQRREIIRNSIADSRPSGVQEYEYSRRDPGYEEYQDRRKESGGGSKITADIEARKSAAEALGLRPGSPAYQSYTLTGKMPREDQQPLSASDKKAILEADEAVATNSAVMGNLKQAMDLSKKAYSGPLAPYLGRAGAIVGSEAGRATVEYDNLVTTNALTQLKSIFGAAPTEGERKILLDIQGSSSQPQAVRDAILTRAYAAAERRLEMNKQRASEMRGGTYFKPDGGPDASRAQPQSRAPAQPSLNPADIVDRRTVGGKTYARTSDGRVFEVSP